MFVPNEVPRARLVLIVFGPNFLPRVSLVVVEQGVKCGSSLIKHEKVYFLMVKLKNMFGPSVFLNRGSRVIFELSTKNKSSSSAFYVIKIYVIKLTIRIGRIDFSDDVQFGWY